jgi:hypothetical protein
MHWQQYVIAGWLGLNCLMAIVKHGDERPPVDAWNTIIATAFLASVFGMTGFWSMP